MKQEFILIERDLFSTYRMGSIYLRNLKTFLLKYSFGSLRIKK